MGCLARSRPAPYRADRQPPILPASSRAEILGCNRSELLLFISFQKSRTHVRSGRAPTPRLRERCRILHLLPQYRRGMTTSRASSSCRLASAALAGPCSHYEHLRFTLLGNFSMPARLET